VVDSTLEEEICMNAKVSVGVNKKGMICGIVQTGSGGIAPSTLITLTKNAKHLAVNLIEQIDAAINESFN
jgi:exosome complex component RRP42